MCRESTAHNDVRFLGKQEEMEDILAVTDLFLLPSEYESFGLAALEAMAAGVPVVSSNAGGLKEINIDGETGYMANVGEVLTMSRRALDILTDEETLNGFKNRSAAHAKKYDIGKIVPIY